MCDECQQLETQIKHHRRFVTAGLDDLTTERIKRLIVELEQRRDALHQGEAGQASVTRRAL
jgi:hypothetical protein